MREISRAHRIVRQDVPRLLQRSAQLSQLSRMFAARNLFERVIRERHTQLRIRLPDLTARSIARDPEQLEVIGLSRESKPLENSLRVDPRGILPTFHDRLR